MHEFCQQKSYFFQKYFWGFFVELIPKVNSTVEFTVEFTLGRVLCRI